MIFSALAKLILPMFVSTLVLAKSSRSIRTRGAGDYAIGFTGTLNGRDFTTHGTVQEMYAQMKEIDPTFEPALKLRRRDYFGPPPGIDSNLAGGYCCPVAGQNFRPAPSAGIEDGENHLSDWNGVVHLQHGCGLLSCSGNAATYVCNDGGDIDVGAHDLVILIEALIQTCSTSATASSTTCGQAFDKRPFNVVTDRAPDDLCPLFPKGIGY